MLDPDWSKNSFGQQSFFFILFNEAFFRFFLFISWMFNNLFFLDLWKKTPIDLCQSVIVCNVKFCQSYWLDYFYYYSLNVNNDFYGGQLCNVFYMFHAGFVLLFLWMVLMFLVMIICFLQWKSNMMDRHNKISDPFCSVHKYFSMFSLNWYFGLIAAISNIGRLWIRHWILNILFFHAL